MNLKLVTATPASAATKNKANITGHMIAGGVQSFVTGAMWRSI